MAFGHFLIKFWIMLCHARALCATLDLRTFTICKDHYASCRIRARWNSVRVFQCYLYCGRNNWCHALTVKPVSGGVECTFHEGIIDVNCQSFPFQENYKLLLKNEIFVSSNNTECQNGGSFTGSGCECLEGFTGDHCERYVYHCNEARTTGVTLTSDIVVPVMIKPMGNTFAFEALCNKYGQIVLLLRHTDGLDVTFNRSFEEYQYAFGINNNYWIGLENLYATIHQGAFKLQIFCHNLETNDMFSVYYNTFRIADSNRYRMSVGSKVVANDGSDGFGANRSNIPFCTYDRPCNGFPKNGNGGWWYVTGLEKYALTNPNSTVVFKYQYNDFSADSLSMAIGNSE